MARYRVYCLREDLSRRFRELPPASVKKQVKQREYELAGELEAPNPYAAWRVLRSPDASQPPLSMKREFGVGDVLEQEEANAGDPQPAAASAEGPRPGGAKLFLCLFGGFEEASWWTPPPAPPEGGPQTEGPTA